MHCYEYLLLKMFEVIRIVLLFVAAYGGISLGMWLLRYWGSNYLLIPCLAGQLAVFLMGFFLNIRS